jgi:cysteinyl-tRNA synthetase
MAMKYLGTSFDLHGGGEDLIFPHHECEIAQAETLSGKPLARYWLHSGPVTVDGKPMSAENKNLVTVRELLESEIRGAVIRAALLEAPYGEPLDFGEAALDRARDRVDTVLGFHEHVAGLDPASATGGEAAGRWVEEADRAFQAEIDDDLGYGRALAAIVERIQALEPERIGSARAALEALTRWDRVLGIL